MLQEGAINSEPVKLILIYLNPWIFILKRKKNIPDNWNSSKYSMDCAGKTLNNPGSVN